MWNARLDDSQAGIKITRININLNYEDDTTLMAESEEELSESRSVVSDSLQPHGLYSPWYSPTGVDSHSILRGIFLTQGLNPGFPHCRQILHQLSHQGSPHGGKENINKVKNVWFDYNKNKFATFLNITPKRQRSTHRGKYTKYNNEKC